MDVVVVVAAVGLGGKMHAPLLGGLCDDYRLCYYE